MDDEQGTARIEAAATPVNNRAMMQAARETAARRSIEYFGAQPIAVFPSTTDQLRLARVPRSRHDKEYSGDSSFTQEAKTESKTGQ